MSRMKSFYKGKTILVTGGVGSIGRELVKKILTFNPCSIRILDNNETGLFDLVQELKSDKIRPLIGDIRDKERLQRAFEDVHIVFHAAALKHVPLCEFNPFEAVMTNLIGTQNVLSAALDQKVQKVILISTDKAVNPTNVMGATKLVAERLTISASHYKGNRDTIFSCVRFGNVLNSRGSVIPLFHKQIQNGGPVTITDPKMTRFIMSIPRSIELILKSAELSQGGEIFILKMPSVQIQDLAEGMMECLVQKYGLNKDDVRIKIIGKRPGEKMHEELLTVFECEDAYENDEMFIILPKNLADGEPYTYKIPENWRKIREEHYSSNNAHILSKHEIIAIINENCE